MKKLSAVMLLSFAVFQACGDEKKKSSAVIPGNIVSVNAAYNDSGSLSVIGGTDYTISNVLKGSISTDPFVRSFNGLIYIMNRYGSSENSHNVSIVDPSYDYGITVQKSTGSYSNPYDISVVSSTKAYITRQDTSSIWIVNPSTLEKTGEISLSNYAPGEMNGVPTMSYMYNDSARSRVFVAIQRLVSYMPKDYSSVLVINTATDAVETEIKLSWNNNSTNATNPYSDFVAVPASSWQPAAADSHDHLFISCTGLFGYYYTIDCGIVAIDLIDLKCEEGYVVSESDMNAEAVSLALKGTDLYMILSDSIMKNSVQKLSLKTKSLTSILSTGIYPSMVLNNDGKLYVCDANATNPGIRIIDTNNSDSAVFADPLSTGLPPVNISLIK